MHIDMYQPTTGGPNAVATVVPRECMNQQYGTYTERFKVVHEDPGFKSTHLFYQGGYEIDYPENDYGSSISAYTHPGGANYSTSAQWTDWHTTKNCLDCQLGSFLHGRAATWHYHYRYTADTDDLGTTK